ncbi:glycosyltransferase family 2 protein [Paraburkholderia sediminicola]|uniref:glycosyltransferase family 2 protein n=1 Tax=Paraburkholderia sediminicola TaxID=458836 RepID=UPI0038B8D710
MSMPKVSILLPIYNVEPYVEDCLVSLLSQTCTDFEIIAVDDRSPDRSGEIVSRVLKSQDKVAWKLITNKSNQGLAETRRIAAMEAIGDYVLCVDSDDYVHPRLIGRVIEEAVEHNADVVIFAATNVNPDDTVNYQIDSEDNVITGVEAVERIMDLSLQAYCWNKLVRRSIFVGVHHPSGLIYEDLCVSVQTLGRSNTVRLIPDHLYFYVLREGGISTRFNPKILDLVTIMDLVEKTTASLPIANWSRRFFRLKYIYGFRTIAFQVAMRAPTYQLASPILRTVSERLRLQHLYHMYVDSRPRLTFVMCLLKIHPRIFYSFVRRFGER